MLHPDDWTVILAALRDYEFKYSAFYDGTPEAMNEVTAITATTARVRAMAVGGGGGWQPLADGEIDRIGNCDRLVVRGRELVTWQQSQGFIARLPDEIRLCAYVPAPGLAMPDSPGHWTFEGSEWKSEPVFLKDGVEYEEWQEEWTEEAEEYWHRHELELYPVARYRKVKGKPFRAMLQVRYSTVGEQVRFSDSMGRYDGEKVLGYIPQNPTWNHYLHHIDMLTGTWTRLYLPWEQPTTKESVGNVE